MLALMLHNCSDNSCNCLKAFIIINVLLKEEIKLDHYAVKSVTC